MKSAAHAVRLLPRKDLAWSPSRFNCASYSGIATIRRGESRVSFSSSISSERGRASRAALPANFPANSLLIPC